MLQRWFVDGTVKCFSGGHLPLAIMAILILIVYVLLVTFVIALILKKIKVSVSMTITIQSVKYIALISILCIPIKLFVIVKKTVKILRKYQNIFDTLIWYVATYLHS